MIYPISEKCDANTAGVQSLPPKPAEVAEPEPQPEVKPAVQPLGGGDTGGTTGENAGTPGPGEDEEKSSPFNIEGLNRSAVYSPLPQYAEKVNAVIKMRIKDSHPAG